MYESQSAPLYCGATKIDDPVVRDACSNHEPSQSVGFRDVAFVQIEAAALLVGEKRLDAETLPIRKAGILSRLHVADEEDGFFAVLAPPTQGRNGTVALFGEMAAERFGVLSNRSVLDHILKMKGFAFPAKLGVGGRTADITPTAFLNGRKQVDAVELAVAQKNHLRLWRNQCGNFLSEIDVSLLRQMPLLALDHRPGEGQRSFFVDQTNHQSHAPATNRAPVHCQHEGQVAQA